MYAATMAESTMTMTARRMTVWRSGPGTCCSSDQPAGAKRIPPTLPVRAAGACERAATRTPLHGGSDSESQPLVLETSALPVELPPYAACPNYRVSLCAVCFRHRGQNFESSIRAGSFLRCFVVAYVRDRQVEHASVMIGRLSFGI